MEFIKKYSWNNNNIDYTSVSYGVVKEFSDGLLISATLLKDNNPNITVIFRTDLEGNIQWSKEFSDFFFLEMLPGLQMAVPFYFWSRDCQKTQPLLLPPLFIK